MLPERTDSNGIFIYCNTKKYNEVLNRVEGEEANLAVEDADGRGGTSGVVHAGSSYGGAAGTRGGSVL